MESAFRSTSEEETDLFALVLASQGIGFERFDGEGHELRVRPEDLEKAHGAIALYLEENSECTVSSPFVQRFHSNYSGLFVAAMMFAIHSRLPAGEARQTLVEKFGASASHILDGDLYRLVTALFLHGDDMHLVSNMGGLLLFGTSVAGITGSGLGWFMILWSGILGNGLNAMFFKTQHLSIGSSTAIFGAVGILAAYRSVVMFREKGRHPTVVLPLGAGLALLGLLGSSSHSDVTAHLFGYICGLPLGTLYATRFNEPSRDWVQILFTALSAVIVGWAWMH